MQTDASDDGLVRGYDASGNIQLQFDTDGGDSYIAQGNVGIGLTDPNYDLSVGGSSGSHYIQVRSDDSTSTLGLLFADAAAGNKGAIFYDQSAEDMFFRTNNSERMRIASDGSVGIGTSSPSDNLHIASSLATIRLEDSDVAGGASYSLITSSSNGNIQFSADPDNVRSSTDIRFSIDGSEAMRIDSSGDVGIGTSSPASLIHANNTSGDATIRITSSDTGYAQLFLGDQTSGSQGRLEYYNNNNSMGFYTGGSEAMRITSSGSVAIGTSSPSDYYATDLVIDVPSEGGMTIVGGTTDENYVMFADGTADLDQYRGYIGYSHASNYLRFGSNGTEAFRLDASGNLLVGTTDTTPFNNSAGTSADFGFVVNKGGGYTSLASYNTTPLYINRTSSDGDIVNFRKDGTTVGSIGNVGNNVYYSGGSPLNFSTGLLMKGASVSNTRLIAPSDDSGTELDDKVSLGRDVSRFKDLYLSGAANVGGQVVSSSSFKLDTNVSTPTGNTIFRPASNTLAFGTNSSEAMRIDSSGNLLVGQTTASDSAAGIYAAGSGRTSITRDGGFAIRANRLTSDGEIIRFAKDGSTVGSIGNRNSTESYISLGSAGLTGSSTSGGALLPTTGGAAYVDDVLDLGFSSGRFDNIYATNGTIQTSDQNEKQQIASLTDAEITAAKAISKLFKTFKWNDSVAEKGDAARTHTGVIAQEIEQAMTDAGLNAGDYAFFISTTWWEADGETYEIAEEAPEGATERNRKGIRYPQLLSFIGAATEQRLTSIESRLDALEA